MALSRTGREAGRNVRFGPLEFDLQTRELTKYGIRLRVQDQPLQILAALVEHAGEIVPREELQRALWPDGTFVEYEQSLNKAVNKLREALGDSAGQPLYIETVARRGYRFIAPIESTPAAPGPVARRPLRRFQLWVAVALAALGCTYIVVRRIAVPAPLRVVAVRQLTHDSRGKVGMVTDGRRVYFGYAGGVVAEVPAEGGEPVPLPTSFRGYPWDLSRDGRNALLAEEFEHGMEGLDYPLWVLRVPDGIPRRVGAVRATGAAWSPDGGLIAFTQGNALTLCSGEGGPLGRVGTFDGRTLQPRWSVDGSTLRVLVVDRASNRCSLWMVDRDGRNRRELLPAYPGLLNGAGNQDWERTLGRWFPNGRQFLVSGLEGGFNHVWALPSSSGHPRQLTFGPVEYWAPTPSADGKSLFAIGGQRRGEVMLWNANARGFVRFGFGLSAEGVEFSPDGKWIVWVAYPDGTLWRSRPDGTDKLQLLSPPLASYLPRWSPDGLRIAAMVREPGSPWKIRIVPANGGPAETVLPGPGPEADPNWSPDGKKLIYAPFLWEVPDGQGAIFTVDLATRKVERLAGSERLFSPRWSPDGRYIVGVDHEPGRLRILDAASGRWTTLTHQNSHFPTWSRDSRYVYFGTAWGQPPEEVVARIRVPAGQPELVASLHGIDRTGNVGPWIGFAPDGAPMVLRDTGNRDIYRLELAR